MQYGSFYGSLNFSDIIFSAMNDMVETCAMNDMVETCAMNDMVETSEVVYLLLSFCEIMEVKAHGSNFLDGTSREGFPKIQSFLQEAVCYWIGAINKLVHDPSSTHIHKTKLALLWGIIRCYPQMIDVTEKTSLLMDLVDALNQLLMIEAGMEHSLLFRFICCSI